MGGPGSGRKSDPFKTVSGDIASIGGQPLVLPNLSEIKTGSQANIKAKTLTVQDLISTRATNMIGWTMAGTPIGSIAQIGVTSGNDRIRILYAPGLIYNFIDIENQKITLSARKGLVGPTVNTLILDANTDDATFSNDVSITGTLTAPTIYGGTATTDDLTVWANDETFAQGNTGRIKMKERIVFEEDFAVTPTITEAFIKIDNTVTASGAGATQWFGVWGNPTIKYNNTAVFNTLPLFYATPTYRMTTACTDALCATGGFYSNPTWEVGYNTGAGQTSNVFGYFANPVVQRESGKTGDGVVPWMGGYATNAIQYGITEVGTGITVSNYAHFCARNPFNIDGSITNEYGLYVYDITNGTNNYAIKTNAGLVDFGDDVDVAGNVDVTGSITATGSITIDSDARIPGCCIWAEEGSVLNTATAGGLQFSFGNGATGNWGVKQPGAGTVVAMSINVDTDTGDADSGQIDIAINGTAQGGEYHVHNPGAADDGSCVTFGTPLAFSLGDRLTFRTVTNPTTGTTTDIVMAMWIVYT